MKPRKNIAQSALLEIGILFLPAIPAYLWIWPNLKGAQTDLVQALVYLYFLVGALWIGLRHWTWDQLGINRKGIGLTLACGLVILAARWVIIFSIDWGVHPLTWSWFQFVGNLVYYLLFVGLVEELLFRGLIYRLLEDWRGVGWALWGSSIGFGLWHIFGQGPLAGIATFLIGLLFTLIRLRAGGIIGPILLHALWDLQSAWLVSDSNAVLLDPSNFSLRYPLLAWLGTIMLLLVPVYLGWVHPRIMRTRTSGRL
jgi:membrane protease YdiL (CAAX protease family)